LNQTDEQKNEFFRHACTIYLGLSHAEYSFLGPLNKRAHLCYPPPMLVDHIVSMGYVLEYASDTSSLSTLLNVCNLSVREENENDAYHVLKTGAGGVAACIGWSIIGENQAVIHSLAVAPTSRGNGLGVGVLATAMAKLKDENKIDNIFICSESPGVFRLFSNFGFYPQELSDLPYGILEHSTFSKHKENSGSTILVRSYKEGIKRGFDKCAFQLIENQSENATTPLGSIFLFQQRGSVVESNFRGGDVLRGHLLGRIEGDDLSFVYHTVSADKSEDIHAEKLLSQGKGHIQVHAIEDGRRELRETFSSDSALPNELILREL